MGKSLESRPLARDISIGAAVTRNATRNPFRRRKTVARKTASQVGDHRRGARGSDDPSDVLADRSRLQKSTGGVWPLAFQGEEPWTRRRV